MKNTIASLLGTIALLLITASAQDPAGNPVIHDVVVYGDSSGAVVAAISAKREGRSVIWINPTGFPGGMSASGLGATDFLGYRNTFGGLASEFYDGVAKEYGAAFVRSFEPHVGRKVFEKMIADSGVEVVYNDLLDRTPGKGVTMEGKRITAITTLNGKTYRGRMFIDATYVGDLMAAAGVSYTVGREAESQYGEDLAGVRRGDTHPRVHYGQKDKDHFVKEVDPYIKAGDSGSGLLPHVVDGKGLVNGQGDRKIQAFNYRVCLTSDPENRIPIGKPEGYREIDHELLLRNFDAGDTRMPALIEPLAGSGKKVDWNNMHAVGSDYVGANYEYPEASYERRIEIEKAHQTYIRGFLWTMSHSPRVPQNLRERAAAFGLPKDEFTDNGGWPWMIYIREARRMVSDYVMTQHDCMGDRKAADPIALGSFGMDSHAVQHIVTHKGTVQNEGVIWRTPPRPYGISYRSIIPKKGECENLFSPVCLSASHVAHGSIRMEPVFMAMSQSAAIAAGLAIDGKTSVQEVPYGTLQKKLDAAKQIHNPTTWKREARTTEKAEVFDINGHKAHVYSAPRPAKGKPWIWYAPVIHGDVILVKHKAYFDAFMGAGIAIAGYDIGEVRGAPRSTGKFTEFYDSMVERGYSKQPILLGQSRGGMMTLAWAFRNPEKVRAWAGIYPVCNYHSWPLKSSMEQTLNDFAMTEAEFRSRIQEFNPIDHLDGLAKHKVPMFSVHGDNDKVVPYIDNTRLLQENYQAAGGTCDVKIIPGGGHENSPGFFGCQELIDFIIRHAKS